MRATAFTFDACHHPLSCVYSFTRSRSLRSLRFPRTGTLIFICATASVGLSRVSRSASSETGCSIRSSVSLSRAIGVLGHVCGPVSIERRIEAAFCQQFLVCSPLDLALGADVDRGGGLVQNQDPGIGEQRARQRDELPLAEREA